MWKWLENAKKLFIKPSSLQDGLNAVKSKFGDIGEIIYQKPGLRYYKINGSDDILEVGIKEINAGKKTHRSFSVHRLMPSDTNPTQYKERIGSMGWMASSRSKDCTSKFFATINDVTPEELANKFEPGGLSKEIPVNGKSYFAPKTSCIRHDGSATRIYH